MSHPSGLGFTLMLVLLSSLTTTACTSSGADGFANLGAPYSCGGSECVIGASFCHESGGGQGGHGAIPVVVTCDPIPAGSPCRDTPSCACICGDGSTATCRGCNCQESSGGVTLECAVP